MAGDLVDGDADGIPNLLEFALFGNPQSSDLHILPHVSTFSGRAELRFTRPEPADVDYVIEASVDMATWSVIATLASNSSLWTGDAAVTETNAGSSREVVVRDVVAPTTTPRFFRLRIVP